MTDETLTRAEEAAPIVPERKQRSGYTFVVVGTTGSIIEDCVDRKAATDAVNRVGAENVREVLKVVERIRPKVVAVL